MWVSVDAPPRPGPQIRETPGFLPEVPGNISVVIYHSLLPWTEQDSYHVTFVAAPGHGQVSGLPACPHRRSGRQAVQAPESAWQVPQRTVPSAWPWGQ